MTDDLFEKRRDELTEALKKAARDLLAHERLAPAAIVIELGAEDVVAVGIPESIVAMLKSPHGEGHNPPV